MRKLVFLIFLIISINSVSAAHFIVGYVGNAFDGKVADGNTIVLWNPVNGISDNLTDVIGPSGNSGTNNYFMVDCELLNTPCNINDNLSIQVINNGDGYVSSVFSANVSGAGFDAAGNARLNSPPFLSSLVVDDSNSVPSGEIDLVAAFTQTVNCNGVVVDYDNESDFVNASAVFFDKTNSAYYSSDDNRTHYTNSSCFIDKSYGNANQSLVNCSFNVYYYANSGQWNCTIAPYDIFSSSKIGSNITLINTLLAINTSESLDFGNLSSGAVSNESQINITNFGNVMINITLSGYAETVGDGYAMNCSGGNPSTVPIYYQKYNITSSNPGSLTLTQFEDLYKNLSSANVNESFNLGSGFNSVNSTYWRIYANPGITGSCKGNIFVGAVRN